MERMVENLCHLNWIYPLWLRGENQNFIKLFLLEYFEFGSERKTKYKIRKVWFVLPHTWCYDMAFFWPTNLGLTRNNMYDTDLTIMAWGNRSISSCVSIRHSMASGVWEVLIFIKINKYMKDVYDLGAAHLIVMTQTFFMISKKYLRGS